MNKVNEGYGMLQLLTCSRCPLRWTCHCSNDGGSGLSNRDSHKFTDSDILLFHVFHSRNGVEVVSISPCEFTAGWDFDLDVGFGSNDGAHGPDFDVDQGPITMDRHTGTGLVVFNLDPVVGCGLAESAELAIEGIAAFQVFRKSKLISLNRR